jgi:hypothetical protein
MGPLGGFWPKLGRKRVTGWKQRSCVPPGRVKTNNKQTNNHDSVDPGICSGTEGKDSMQIDRHPLTDVTSETNKQTNNTTFTKNRREIFSCKKMMGAGFI